MHDHHASMISTVPSWFLLAALMAALALYLLAAHRQERRRASWSLWRTISFSTGIVLLVIATTPSVSALAHSDLRGHMAQHLLIGMFAPLGLVLGAPVTLLLRSMPVEAGRSVASLLRSPVVHVLGHPVTAAILNIGGMYVLYLTPLFAATMSSQTLHWLVNLHFLAAGYLYAWSIAGPDPAPGRPGVSFRVGVLVVALGAHAYLGKAMYAHLWPRGTHFTGDEIRAAAELMYYGGDLAEFLLAIALFATWYQQRRRTRLRARERTGTQNSERRLEPAVNTP